MTPDSKTPKPTFVIASSTSIATSPNDRLLNDTELSSVPDPQASPVNSNWRTWLQANNYPVRSLTSSNFADLQFLKPLLEDKRLVMLGESSHGVAEFDQIKVRLVKFLHEELGFDVVAFESSIFESFYADQQIGKVSPTQTMTTSIFGMWHTQETLPLFEYLQATRSTNHPLHLAGFDIQPSSYIGAEARPQFLKDVIKPINDTYAQQVFDLDTRFLANLQGLTSSEAIQQYVNRNGDALTRSYQELVSYLDAHEAALTQAYTGNPERPLLARQTAWSILQTLRCLHTDDENQYLRIRDQGMADNVDFLINKVYPGKRVIIWAHNTHIFRRGQDIRDDSEIKGAKTMGAWLAERHPTEIYAIGMYMYRGEAVQNGGQVYSIDPATPGSLESILFSAGRRYLFVDLSNQEPVEGNRWMFLPIRVKEWGVDARSETIVPHDQYDGLIFIATVTPPHYIRY